MALSGNAFAPSLPSDSEVSPYYRRTPEFITFDRDLHPFARLLFVVIAQSVNLYSNRIQMTVEHIAQKSELSPSSILRYLPALEAKGYISVERAGKGKKIPNVYHLAGEAARMICAKDAPVAAADSPTTVTETPDTPERPSQKQSSASDNRQPDSRSPVTETVVSPQQPSERLITKQGIVEESGKEEAVVVDPPIFSLKGVSPEIMQSWIDTYGETRVWQVLQALPKQKNVGNPPGWVQSALKNNWQFGHTRQQNPAQDLSDGTRFIMGADADVIRH